VPVAGQVATEHRNSGKRKGHGAEIEATWQALDNLKFTANYAFQRARDTLVDDDVGEAPNHQVYGRAEWRAFDHWHLNTQVNWAGEQKRVAADTRDPATKIRNIQTCFNVLGTELYCEHTSTYCGCTTMLMKLARRRLALGVICLTLLGCSETEATSSTRFAQPDEAKSSSSRPNNMVVMREHPLRDPGMNNIVASTVLVPEGWSLEGGITRQSSQLYNMPVVSDVTISAPDGRAVRFFPSFSFEFNHGSPGQEMQPTPGGSLYLPLPESPGQWLMQMVQRNPDPTVSDVRLISEEVVLELTQKLRQQNAQMYQMVEQGNITSAPMGYGQQFDSQATKLVLTYKQNGIAVEETVLVTWHYLIMIHQGQVSAGSWSINLMRSFRGPAGTNYLADAVLSAIVQSIRTNPVWEAEMQRYWQKLAGIQQKGASDRKASWQDHNRKMQKINSDINDIIVGGYQERSAASDRIQQQYVDTIREETPYTTSSGETIKLPSFYDQVYTDGNGTYILNNDAFYNPNTDSTVNNVSWDRIEAQR